MNKIILLSFLFITGCNSQNETADSGGGINADRVSVPDNNNNNTSVNVEGCYAWNIKKDSAFLKLSIAGTSVTGNLDYYLYDKDKNSGSINGSLRDSLIVADYTFQSEGTTSVRQVVFKMKSDTLLEGFGDIIMEGDTARFKDIAQLKFQNDRPFLKTNCR